MIKETQKWKPIPKSSGSSIDELNDLSARIRDLEKREAVIKSDIERMERRSDRSANFMMVMIVGIAIVFLATLVTVALDYFKNNGERFERTTTMINDFEKNISDKYYTKEQMDKHIKSDEEMSNVIQCIRSKRFFSMACFDL